MNFCKFFTCITLFSVTILVAQTKMNSEFYFKKATDLKLTQPDSSVVYYQKSADNYLKKRDTVEAIKSLIAMSDVYAHNVNYGKAYDGYWKALLLSEKKKIPLWSGRAYLKLGYLYSFFKRDSKALEYFNKSLKISKELNRKGETRLGYLLSDYYSLTNFYRSSNNYNLARKYLDTCFSIQRLKNPKISNYYIEVEHGFLLSQEKKYDLAFKKLYKCKNYFEEKNHPYIIITDYLLGHIHMQLGDFEKSETAFLKSLNTSNKIKSHSNYKIMNSEALAKLYYNHNKFKKAFKFLNLSKKLNEEIFGSKSESNKELFDIKDNYRIAQEKTENEYRLSQLKHKENISFLKQIILVISLLSVCVFSYIFIKKLRNKHKTEKQVIKKRQEDTLELKNKELAASALQLIEKDEFLENLSQKISEKKGTISLSDVKNMIKSVQRSTSSNWKEFETRFTNINQSFYKNLRKQFPDLGKTDQKICALIKLNLPTKEMASLLGISVESVYTSRYRLRKKLNLERDENLTEFLNNL